MALAGVAAAETVIYDITGTTPSYGTYEDITIISSGAIVEDIGAAVGKSASLNGSTITFKTGTGKGTARGMLGSGAKWSQGLPVDLGISADDVLTLTSTGAYITGNTPDSTNGHYPGVITLTISGLSKGTYSLSALSAKGTGDTSPITMNLTVAGSAWTADEYTNNASYYSYSNGAWSGETSGQPTFSAVANNTPSAAYATFDNIEIMADNSTLVLTLTGSPASSSSQNLKALQFVSIKSVPEPTTATLGLLALAGLAARRRRR